MEGVFCLLIMISTFFSSHNNIHETHTQLNDSTIYWCSNSQLTWQLFQGETDSTMLMSARIFTEISVIPVSNSNGLSIEIAAFFFTSSWRKSTVEVTSSLDLLAHEQIHFNITELVARRLRKIVSDTLVTKSNIHDITDMLTIKKRSMLDDLNRRYDKETLHGLILNEQKLWDKKVNNELKLLSEYSIHCM